MIEQEPDIEHVLLFSEEPHDWDRKLYKVQLSWDRERRFGALYSRVVSLRKHCTEFLFQNAHERLSDCLEMAEDEARKWVEENYTQKIFDSFFMPPFPMPYLRRETKYQSRDSYQMHLIDLQRIEVAKQLPGPTEDFLALQMAMMEEDINTSQMMEENPSWPGGNEEIIGDCPVPPLCCYMKRNSYVLSKNIPPNIKDEVFNARWGSLHGPDAPGEQGELISHQKISKEERILSFLGLIRALAEVYCQIIHQVLESVFQGSDKDCILLLMMYNRFWQSFTYTIEELDAQLRGFSWQLLDIYNAIWKDADLSNNFPFHPWKLLTRMWKHRVFLPFQDSLNKGFLDLDDIIRSKRIHSMFTPDGQVAMESEETLNLEELWSLHYNGEKLKAFCYANPALAVRLSESFVNSVIDVELDEVTALRIGNSSRSLPFGKAYALLEESFMENGKRFYLNCLEMLKNNNGLEFIPSLLSCETRTVSIVFPRTTQLAFLEAIHEMTFKFIQHSFNVELAFQPDESFLRVFTNEINMMEKCLDFGEPDFEEADESSINEDLERKLELIQLPLVIPNLNYPIVTLFPSLV